MTGLLDTHTFLWSVVSPEKLSAKVREVIADPANEIYISIISFWEIALKYSLGKLELVGGAPEHLVETARQMGLEIVEPTAEESASFHRLPRMAHKDPFDRMLVWQCMQRGWTLITHDDRLDDYVPLGLQTAW